MTFCTAVYFDAVYECHARLQHTKTLLGVFSFCVANNSSLCHRLSDHIFLDGDRARRNVKGARDSIDCKQETQPTIRCDS